jgi:hypothetical protein
MGPVFGGVSTTKMPRRPSAKRSIVNYKHAETELAEGLARLRGPSPLRPYIYSLEGVVLYRATGHGEEEAMSPGRWWDASGGGYAMDWMATHVKVNEEHDEEGGRPATLVAVGGNQNILDVRAFADEAWMSPEEDPYSFSEKFAGRHMKQLTDILFEIEGYGVGYDIPFMIDGRPIHALLLGGGPISDTEVYFLVGPHHASMRVEFE